MTTENEVKVWCNLNQDAIKQEEREGIAAGEGPVPGYIMPVFEAGVWFGQALEKAGATEEEREAACFAMGQRACMGGPNRAYQIAAECYDRWVEGHADQPGRALAEDLCAEAGFPDPRS